jgi:uncharacterized membrane protein YfcA
MELAGRSIQPHTLTALHLTLASLVFAARLLVFRPRSDFCSWERSSPPMGFGSVIGALLGGLLVGVVPVSVLKFALGVILIVSAVRIFRHR